MFSPGRIRPALILMLAAALAFSGCSAEARKSRRLTRANEHFAAGAYDKAEIEYLNVLQIDRGNATAIAQLGTLYSIQGRLGRMFTYLFEAKRLQPENLNVRLRLAMSYAMVNSRKDARAEALYVLDRQPTNEEAALVLAESSVQPEEIADAGRRLQSLPTSAHGPAQHVAAGLLEFRQAKVADARAAFERAIQQDPKYALGHIALASALWSQDDIAGAETSFQTGASLAPPRSPLPLRYVQFCRQTGRIDVARRTLAKITRETPDFLPAWLALAEIAEAERKLEEALAAVNRVLARDAHHGEAMLLHARLQMASGEHEKAITELERAATIYPALPLVHYQLGVAYAAKGELGKAGSSLSKALRLFPNQPAAAIALAEVSFRQGNAAAAIAGLKAVIQQHPALHQARLLLGSVYRSQRHWDDALAVYREFEKVAPGRADTSLLTGMVLLEQGKKPEARLAFARSLEIAPDFFPAVEQRVRLELEEKRYDVAKELVERTLVRTPKSAGLHLLLAQIALAQSDTTTAENCLRKAVELEPDSIRPYVMLARLHMASGQVDQATAKLEQAVAANPKAVEPTMLLGTLREQQRNLPAARELYEKVIALNPRSGAALNNLAYLYAEHFNELDKAYELARRARQLMPNEPHTADTFGWILYRRAQYPWALTLLMESAEHLPTSPDVQFHLGMTHYMLGAEKPARTSLERAVSLKTDFGGIAEAREALAVLALDPARIAPGAKPLLEKRVAGRPDPVAQLRLAALHEREGAHDRASAAYENALKASPTNVHVALAAIRYFNHRKEFARAAEIARSIRQLVPSDPEVAYELGSLVYQSGDHLWAFSLLQESTRSMPDNAEARFALANAAYAVGQIALAESSIREALRSNLSPAHADAARLWLEMHALAADPDKANQARSKIEAVLKEDPKHLAALMAQGSVLEHRSNPASAQGHYEAVLNRYPNFSPARKRLTLLYASITSPPSKAVEVAAAARSAFPNDTEVAKAFGIILYHTKEYGRASTLLQETVRQRETDAEAGFYLGMARYHLQQPAQCRRDLQRALDLNLRAELAGIARETILKLGEQKG